MGDHALVGGVPAWWRRALWVVASLGLLGLGVWAGLATVGGRDEPAPEAIVALAGPNDRIRSARSLVERGIAPRLMTTLVDPGCIRRGGSPASCRSGVRSTVDEALLMRRVLRDERIRRVVVVTSGYHRFRAALIFGIVFFGSETRVRVVGTPEAGTRALIAREVLKMLPSGVGALVGRVSPGLYTRLAHLVESGAR